MRNKRLFKYVALCCALTMITAAGVNGVRFENQRELLNEIEIEDVLEEKAEADERETKAESKAFEAIIAETVSTSKEESSEKDNTLLLKMQPTAESEKKDDLETLLTDEELSDLVAEVEKKSETFAIDDPEAGRAQGKGATIDASEVNPKEDNNCFLENAASEALFGVTTHTDVRRGIDVSQWNGTIDWSAVKNAGYRFAFIRCGLRGYGAEGNLKADSTFSTNIKGAIGAGIPSGVYFFSQATTEDEAKEEADLAVGYAKKYNIKLPIVMDFEFAGNGKEGRLFNANLSKSAATSVCQAFCNRVRSYGYDACVYANKSMLTSNLNSGDISAKNSIWLAEWTNSPTFSGKYTFWQYTDAGTVPGIRGRVDLDYWYFNGYFNNCYEIVFNGNGADGGDMENGHCVTGTPVELTNGYTKKGYSFEGWNTKADGNGTMYLQGQEVKNLAQAGESITLYAQWKPVVYTITYVYNGGQITSTVTLPATYTIESPTFTIPSPTKAGYEFDGWYSDRLLTKSSMTVNGGSIGNLVLYAKWIFPKFTVSFRANGASIGAMNDMSGLIPGEKATLAANTFTRKGYRFTGWNTSADGSGTLYADKQQITCSVSGGDNVLVLYAQWTKVPGEITYVTDGGHFSQNEGQTEYDSDMGLVLDTPIRYGYSFGGWYTESTFEKKVISIEKGCEGNITLYAQWFANRYTIAFDGNGAEGAMYSMQELAYDTEYLLNSNTFMKDGFTFAGWNTMPDGSGESFEENASVTNLTETNKKIIMLYAQWEEN